MRTIGNIVWHIPFMGFLTAVGTFIVGGLLMATILGAPFGVTLMRLAKFILSPLRYDMVPSSEVNPYEYPAWRIFGIVVWIIYLPFAIVLSLALIVQIAGMYCSIVGIPAALALAKVLPIYLTPINTKCVSVAVRDALQLRQVPKPVWFP